MKSACVFCGGNPGVRPSYLEAAIRLGNALGTRGIMLVYGGASVGLMGAVADAALAAGGTAKGVIPRMLVDREIAHHRLTELVVVSSMHERKATMADSSEGFIALPGGFGTMDELFEILTWAQLGLHNKPIGLFNVDGYYDHLLAFLDHAAQEGLLKREHRATLLVANDTESLLDQMERYQGPRVDAVIKPGQT
ncbi:MAG: TIGR00730 family Rossman fold protein [Byssovorax sp.]